MARFSKKNVKTISQINYRLQDLQLADIKRICNNYKADNPEPDEKILIKREKNKLYMRKYREKLAK